LLKEFEVVIAKENPLTLFGEVRERSVLKLTAPEGAFVLCPNESKKPISGKLAEGAGRNNEFTKAEAEPEIERL